MPKRWNISPFNAVPNLRHDIPAVQSGESFDFTDEEVDTLGPEWIDKDPRRGLAAEREFKTKRDTKKPAAAEPETTESTEPAVSGDNEGEQP